MNMPTKKLTAGGVAVTILSEVLVIPAHCVGVFTCASAPTEYGAPYEHIENRVPSSQGNSIVFTALGSTVTGGTTAALTIRQS